MDDSEKLESHNAEDSERKKLWWFYPLCFVVGVLGSILILSLGTVFATLEDIWQKQGRIESTKTEFFIGHFVGGTRDKLIRAGFDPESWVVSTLTNIDLWAYHRAIEKIPENNFERLFWHYQSFVKPKMSLPENRYREALDYLVNDAVEKLSQFDQYQITSRADYDVFRHQIVFIYSSDFLSYAKEIDRKLYNSHLETILERVCESARTINPEAIATYQLDSAYRTLYWSLANAYLSTGKNAFDSDGDCNAKIAACWTQVSDKVSRILLNNEALAMHYRAEQKVSEHYEKLKSFYLGEDGLMRNRIETECSY